MSTLKDTDLKSKNLVESIIQRKGGTEITFGYGHHKQVKYMFKAAPQLPDVPHVCVVDNQEHRERLLEIKEGFRLYNAQDTDSDQDDDTPPPSFNLNKGSGIAVDYEDLLGLNADEVTTDWLKAYAKDHLQISATSKAAITEYAQKNYGLELEGTMTPTNMLRAVMKAEQANQQKESDAAKLANT